MKQLPSSVPSALFLFAYQAFLSRLQPHRLLSLFFYIIYPPYNVLENIKFLQNLIKHNFWDIDQSVPFCHDSTKAIIILSPIHPTE
ncbi:MAG: hypothetical protein H6Q73_4452 [Firmicutes bacterium]|nr:hypothetical protein [Bacillota bacterium]